MAYEIFGNDITEIKAEPTKAPVTSTEETEQSCNRLEGRNSVLEAIKAGRTIDKVYIQDGLRDGSITTILSKLKGTGTVVSFVKKQRLDQMSETGHHQGVIAQTTAYEYAEIEDIFALAKKKGEPPFIIILDEIEDPHNLGAIIRTANICGAHGVIIPKHRATGITNISNTIEELKLRGLWFACADMDGEVMYKCNLTGAIGLVIGNEGSGVSRLVKEKCDYVVSIPMMGQIESLNASVAAGVLAYEIVRQRYSK